MHFKNTFCTTSLCSPSRATILSGLHAHAHGVVNKFTEYPKTLQSFPRVLQSEGYDTAYKRGLSGRATAGPSRS